VFQILLVAAAWAADDPPDELPDPSAGGDPPGLEEAVGALQAEVQKLRTELEQLRMDQLLAEAEALATPPLQSQSAPLSLNAFNPRLTAFGDMLTSVGIDEGQVAPESGPWLRSLELDLRADVDPYAKAVAIFAVHQDPPLGDAHSHGPEPEHAEEEHSPFHAVPEEVYVDFVSLPGGFSARAGAFRQAFGIANRAHPHDWPWPDAPAALVHALGPEGYADAGAQVTWRVPNPMGTGISFTGGAMDGSLFDPDRETAVPEWVGRAEWFHEVRSLDFAVGGSGTGLGDQRVLGADAMIRLKLDGWRSVLFLGELIGDADDLGGYAAVQVQPTRPLYLGLRGDFSEGEPALGAYASYYTSEFLRLRAGSTIDEHRIAAHAQLTFVWGSHPVEPYWVNR